MGRQRYDVVLTILAVASAPAVFRVRVWHLTSRHGSIDSWICGRFRDIGGARWFSLR